MLRIEKLLQDGEGNVPQHEHKIQFMKIKIGLPGSLINPSNYWESCFVNSSPFFLLVGS